MLVGALIYVAFNARSKTSYAVNRCSRYLAKATKAHYEVLKQILRYLAGVKHTMLTWCASAALKKRFHSFPPPDLLIR